LPGSDSDVEPAQNANTWSSGVPEVNVPEDELALGPVNHLAFLAVRVDLNLVIKKMHDGQCSGLR
jgi:hypothetical protein